jgi:hypothetical protein
MRHNGHAAGDRTSRHGTQSVRAFVPTLEHGNE